MVNPDAAYIRHMVAATDRIAELVGRTSPEEFGAEWVLQNACIRELEILGEAARKLSAEFVAAQPAIPWKEITGLRHKLIHDYFEVDLDLVWRTATISVPEIAPLLATAAESIGE